MSNGNTVSVSATILGNTIVDVQGVPWTNGMNAQQALEGAYNLRTDQNYGFSVAYYGESWGYFLEEIEQIGDQPGVYWEFFVNGTSSETGIDTTILNAGDAVAFEYQYYDPHQEGSNPQLAAKHQRKAGVS
ncbi:MAG TPA: DUF4430 domain-containing protein [Thermoleophilaceae bacterium]